MREGFKVVLTGDEGLVGTYNYTYLGFASGLPMDVLPSILGELLFPTVSDADGRMKTSQYGLCKIEAALIDAGFSRDDVAIVDPRKIEVAIGPRTRAVGIGVLDPLGVNYGTMLLRVVLELMGVETRLQSYMSWVTMKLLNKVNELKERYGFKVIVGGQGVWEIIDSGLQKRLGIDTIVEGEGELVAPELFYKAVVGEHLPSYVKGPPVPVEKIPIIKTPSRGLVEVTRGCGRGCRFCNPTLLMWRSIPVEKVLREVVVNVRGGERYITLHSEDFLRYGSPDLLPRRDKVLRLLELVRKVPSVEEVSIDFVTTSTVLSDPKLVREVGDSLGLSEGSFSIVQMGIETASPRLLRLIAPGKPKPYSAEEWPKVVEEAVSILNEAGWWICATIIVGLPGEGAEDVEANIKLVERLEPYNVFIFTLPFIPSGSLRRSKGLTTHDILPSRENLELIFIATYDAIKKLRKLSPKLVAKAPPTVKWLLGGLLYFAATIGIKRLQRQIPSIATEILKAKRSVIEVTAEIRLE